jgi:hypothetical protein
MRTATRRLCVSFAVFVGATSGEIQQASAADSHVTPQLRGYVNNVDRLTRQILRTEMRFQAFNLRFRLGTANQSRTKRWRYFAFQEAALELALGNMISAVSYRGENLNNPRELKSGPQAWGTMFPLFLSFASSGTGDSIELLANAKHYLACRRRGTSPGQSRAQASKLVAQIDKLMAERDATIKQEPAAEAATAKLEDLEGKLLHDFRDLSVSEFIGFHKSMARESVTENCFYGLDLAKASIGCTWTGLDMHLMLDNRPRVDTAVGALDLINAALVVVDPVIAHSTGAAAAAIDGRRLVKAGLSARPCSMLQLQTDYKNLLEFLSVSDAAGNAEIVAAIDRTEAYEINNKYYIARMESSAETLSETRRAIVDHLKWGAFIGTSKMPLGVLSTVSGSKFPGRDGIFNSYYFAGSMAYIPAMTLAIADSWRKQLRSEKLYRQLKTENKLPGQILQNRIEILERLQTAM